MKEEDKEFQCQSAVNGIEKLAMMDEELRIMQKNVKEQIDGLAQIIKDMDKETVRHLRAMIKECAEKLDERDADEIGLAAQKAFISAWEIKDNADDYDWDEAGWEDEEE